MLPKLFTKVIRLCIIIIDNFCEVTVLLRKKCLFIFLIFICLCIFFGCTANTFNNLVIIADDVGDIEEGEYTLIYSIKNYEKLASEYNLTIRAKVFDQENNEVDVKNNRTITVQIDYVYTVVVYCSTVIDGEVVTKTKQFVVSAIKSPPSVKFVLRYEKDNVQSLHKTIPLEYNQSLSISEVPSLPDWYANHIEGIEKTIISKEWIVFVDGKKEALKQEHLNNITTGLTVYGMYEYKIVYIPIAISFNANGGTETSTISGIRGTSINRPQTNPTKLGYTFDCWYLDKEFTTPYNWRVNSVFIKTLTLYAKWLDNVGNYTAFENFNFELNTDDNNNKFYAISASNTFNASVLTLPNGYNNIPIKKISDFGFQGKQIVQVYIPSSISILGQNSFENCNNLHTVDFEEGNAMVALGWFSFKGCTNLVTINNFPQKITDLGKQSFQNCSSLVTFIIPDSVDSLKIDLFKGCSSLSSIAVPDSVIEIVSGVFEDCSALSSLTFTINSKLKYIYSLSIKGSAVTNLALPFYFTTVTNPFADTDVTVTYLEEPPEPEVSE